MSAMLSKVISWLLTVVMAISPFSGVKPADTAPVTAEETVAVEQQEQPAEEPEQEDTEILHAQTQSEETIEIDNGENETVKQEGSVLTGKCGELVDFALDYSTGVLTISGIGPMYDYGLNLEHDTRSPFYNNADIETVIFEDGVTSVGAYSFYECTGIESVVFHDQSVKNIYTSAFSNCNSLYEVDFPNSLKKIYTYAFDNCSSLEELYFPGSLEEIFGGAFRNCNNLIKIIFSEGITQIGESAFPSNNYEEMYFPKSLEEIGKLESTSEKITINKLTINSDAFLTTDIFPYGYKINKLILSGNITKIPKISNYDQIDIGGNIECVGARPSVMPHIISDGYSYESSNKYNHVYMGVKSVIIRNNVKIIGGYAFQTCTNITEINIPDSVTFIGDQAFQSCRALTNLIIGNSVEYIGISAFESCFLSYINIPNSVKTIANYAFRYCPAIVDYIKIGNSVEYIGAYAFAIDKPSYDTLNIMTHLTVLIPDSIIEICSGAFNYRYNLNLLLPKSVEKVGSYVITSRGQDSGISTLKYGGTEKEWKDLTNLSNNDTSDNIYFGGSHYYNFDVALFSANSSPNKAEYYVGEKLDTTGFQATASFNDGSTLDVSGYCTFSQTEFTTPGLVNIQASFTFNGSTYTSSFNVLVKELEAESISVKSLPAKTNYTTRLYESIAETEQQIKTLQTERQNIRNRIRRASPEDKTFLKAEAKNVIAKITPLREKLKKLKQTECEFDKIQQLFDTELKLEKQAERNKNYDKGR